jgi:hypothetical protein
MEERFEDNRKRQLHHFFFKVQNFAIPPAGNLLLSAVPHNLAVACDSPG